MTSNDIRVILPAMDYIIEGSLKVLDSGGDREDPLSPGESRSSAPSFKTYIPDAEDLAFSCGEVPTLTRLRAALDEYERNGYLSPAGRAALNDSSDAVEQWSAVLDQLQDNGFYVIEISAEP